jgi:hypothetical protein
LQVRKSGAVSSPEIGPHALDRERQTTYFDHTSMERFHFFFVGSGVFAAGDSQKKIDSILLRQRLDLAHTLGWKVCQKPLGSRGVDDVACIPPWEGRRQAILVRVVVIDHKPLIRQVF